MTVNPEGRFLQLNKGFCDMLGYSHEEMQQMSVDQVTHPDHRRETLDNYRIKRPEKISYDKRYLRRDGSDFWAHVSATWVYDPNQEPRYAIAMVRDITERRLREEQIEISRQHQGILAQMLRIGVEAGALDEQLQRALSLALSAPGLLLEQKGAIFTFDETTGELVLRAHQGLSETLCQKCSRVPLGRCLCGRAAGDNPPGVGRIGPGAPLTSGQEFGSRRPRKPAKVSSSH